MKTIPTPVKKQMKVAESQQSSTFVPSKYQTAIFNWVKNGRGNAIVNATAGSGKSKTLIEASKLLRTDNALFAAFNKHIAEELQDKVPNMQCKTIHSLGNTALYGYLKKTKLDPSKYRNLCYDAVRADSNLSYDEATKLAVSLQKLVSFSQSTLVDINSISALEEMTNHYGIELEASMSVYQGYLKEVLKRGQEQAKTAKVIDFIDMIWLPIVWNLNLKKFEFIFLDECQDLSPCQLQIILKSIDKGGRVLACGDPKQAIFGFSGSDSDSFWNIKATLQAEEFPLSICYRCPKSHLREASLIVPQIEPKEDAIEGVFQTISEDKLKLMVSEGDMIICRKTSPLISLCLELIARRIPAKVKGRDIGKSLSSIVTEIEKMEGFSFEYFPQFISSYRKNKIAKLSKKNNSESAIQSLEDRLEGILICYEDFKVTSARALKEEIESLFSDNRSSVTLSTVHRTKGLENDRVFIIEPSSLPLTWKGQLPWQLEQEMNLKYVALTRAKQELYSVNPKK